LSERQIIEEIVRQIEILRDVEESITVKLDEIENERRALSNEKRHFYSTACLFNVVACYRKKRDVLEGI
ncbi:unnamed protein product, partial [Lymnaea stagnalis]